MMQTVFRILEGQLELNDSMGSYDEFSYVKRDIQEDEKGKFRVEVSTSRYKYNEGLERNDGDYSEKKIYESSPDFIKKCPHSKTTLYGTFHKCNDCEKLLMK